MNIIVAGCGKIGTTIIESLVNEGHNITAVESNEKHLREIINTFDINGALGNAADSDTLLNADIEKCDVFIAVTDSDEINMLACFFARKMGARHTVARIRKTDYNDQSLGFMRQHLEISMVINPDKLAAKGIFNILKLPSAIKIETFSSRNIEMIELRLKPDSILDGVTLSDIRKKYNTTFLVCTVQRADNVFIPDGMFSLKSGDKISIIGDPAELEKLLKKLNLMQKQARKIMILGGSRTSYYLAKKLLALGFSVKIIEQNNARCEELNDLLPSCEVCCADGAKQEILIEEGLCSSDAFVALTGMDEENILISIFAASKSVAKVISKVNRNELVSLSDDLGLDCTVSPHRMTADIIIQYARALQNSLGSKVETLYQLVDGKAEALEFAVKSDFRGVGVHLKELALKNNVLIGGIIRARKTIIPTGDDMIMPGDKVIVLAAGKRLNDLADILK